jgi:predicted RNase H-like HicB family nuclease
MYRFSIVIEKAEGNYSAYSPDLPGCIAVGDTIKEVQKNMEEAMRFHIEGMLEDHEPIPVPQSRVHYVNIAVPNSITSTYQPLLPLVFGQIDCPSAPFGGFGGNIHEYIS